uniref:Putative ovule protein n=1 Tax=Solanum chacoense TaxID=4108 RepID=A0A0V0J264_SOLCH
MLNCNLDLSHEISNSKVWFAMEHPKAEVRRSALLGLDVRGMLNVEAADSQRFGTIQDAILRRLCDEDITVVQAALNLEALPEIISAPLRIDAFRNVLQRCIKLLSSGASHGASLAVDIALSCLQHAAAGLPDEGEHVKMVAALIFPFIMIILKTQRLNLKALEMAKQIKWPFYENLVSVSLLDKKLDSGKISSINVENINVLAKALLVHPEEHLPWLVECCKTLKLSKTLFLLVLLQSFTLLETGGGQFSTFFGICFPILRMEWELLESAGNISEEFNPGLWDGDISILIKHMLATNLKEVNGEILTCLFWRLLGSFSKIAAETEPLDKNENWLCCFRDLFVFLVSRTNHVFKKHLSNVVAKCKLQTSHFLSEFFTDEGVSAALLIGSLQIFTSLCARPDESLSFQLLAEFPSILVPLSSDNQDVRTAAMNTIEGLLSLWSRVDLSRSKNGPPAVWVHFLGEILGLMVQQKRLLISDKNVLSSLFSSLLGNSNDSLLVQHNVGKRFDQTTKEEILASLIDSALRFSAYAKLKILSLLKGVGHTVLRVNGIESLMLDLLDRRQKYHIGFDKSCHKLSHVEVTILCILLELCIKPSTTTIGDLEVLDPVLKALQVSDVLSGDPAILKPCMTVLGDLSNSFYASLKTETQDLVFRHLVLLFRSANGDIQKATREALLRINITCSIVSRILGFICEQKVWSNGSKQEKKRKKRSACNNRDVCLDIIPGGGNVVAFVGSLLDVLLLKKDMENRGSLICPLFKLLQNAFIDNEWIHVAANQSDLHYHSSSGNSQIIADAAVHIQQELLLILEDITASVTSEDKNSMNFDVELLIKCARSASNMVTRNQIFSLLSAISRAKPDEVLDHILEILVVIGESAVTQWDSNFQHIYEDLISAVVPCWLSKTDSADALLQIFVSILPQVSEHQRISMIVHVLRHLGESVSLGSLLYLLFRSLVARNCSSLCDRSDPSFSYSISLITTQWEYLFAVDLLEKYSCTVWLPSILLLLQQIVVSDSDATLFMEQLVAMHFISNKLQDPEIAFKFDSGEDSDNIQLTVGVIMKEIVRHLQLVDSKRKQIGVLSVFRKELKEYMNTVLSAVTKRLTPSVYFKAIVQLLGHVDKCVRRKALGTLSETVKDTGFVGLKHEKRGPALSSRISWFHLDENSLQSLDTLCLEILKLVNSQSESSSSLKLAAVSTLEVLANRFPSDNSVFSACLDSVSKSICTDNSALSSSCLRTTGALINVLGPKALPQLPFVMEGMIKQSHNDLSTVTAETKPTDGDASTVSSIQNDSVLMSILLALEAVVNKLGGFLNPYLGDILELMLLKPQYTYTSELKLKLKADSVRKLIAERVPVRLLLSPLLRVYSDAITCGDSSVSVAFEMIQNLVAAMDRSSVGAYHVRIFDVCLQGLDLRRQHPAAVKNVDAVEKNVINTVVALTMKLTEKMFKPLFMRSIEWSESIVEENENVGTKSIDRSIAFYGLVNSLADSQRSLFVPNFKHLLDGCVRHLMDAEDAGSSLKHKKKKVKLQESNSKKDTDRGLSIGLWHLRALILSSLHKSFLYDTGTLKFLDSANFQVLLKPIVSQLVTDPPVALMQYPNVPSVEEVDDLLVACVGRMAVTAGSDLLWKPLNHEVLMQTRSEKLRSRILGLRIVKYMVENLKEEYLVLLAETIPFLGELLEDVELPVKSLAQEILKEMESMSGESLRQYL